MAELEVIRVRQASWFTRLKRSLTLSGFSLKDRSLTRWFGNGGSVNAGVLVNQDTAFAVAAFYAAVITISWDLASLPLVLFARKKGGGKTRYQDHPLYRLLHDAPNRDQTSFEFRAALMTNALATGNGFAEIERDGAGRPVALWHLDPSRVTQRLVYGDFVYDVSQPSGGHVTIDARDMIHIKGPSLDGMFGLDTVRIAREALGMAIAAERFGANFFSNGAQLGGILHVNGLGAQARENLKEALKARHAGVDRAHKWLLAPENSTFTEVGTNPKDSQLNELREHQIREIARFFKIPVAMIGDLSRATWSNFEQQQLQYYNQCIRPWCVNIEQQFTAKLVSRLERSQQFVEHITEGFLRADVEKRGAYYTQAVTNGWLTINEIRERENLPPLPGGDVARVPMNTEALASTPAADENIVVDSPGRKAAVLAAHRDLLVDAFARLVRRQTDRARKAASTPAKLREFANGFYDDAHQVTTAAEALVPTLRAWLVYIESPANASVVAETVVRQHFADQKRQLIALADFEQGDQYDTSVQKVLARWDQTGPAEVADTLLQRGLHKDGTLATVPAADTNHIAYHAKQGRSVKWLQKWAKTKLAMSR